MIIIVQCNLTAILVAVTLECSVKRVVCKTWTGTLANSADPNQTNRTWRLIRICTVFVNSRKLRMQWNSLPSQSRPLFSVYTQKQSAHQCCQCFDLFQRCYRDKLLMSSQTLYRPNTVYPRRQRRRGVWSGSDIYKGPFWGKVVINRI